MDQGDNGKCFAFRGLLTRREDGIVTVVAKTPEEAKRLLEEGDWEELRSLSGETDFEWDGQDPEEI